MALLTTLLVAFSLSTPPASGASVVLGHKCPKVGRTAWASGKKVICKKSGTKLVWKKIVVVVPPKPPVVTTKYYTPKDPTKVYTIRDNEGCAVAFDAHNNQVTTVRLLALVGTAWLPVKTVSIGWEKTCNDARLPNNKYFAVAQAAVDDGTTIRWKFTGPVNIELRDAQGHGISHPATFHVPIPVKYYTPTDPTKIYTIRDGEGCAVAFDANNNQVTTVRLLALVGSEWLEVRTQKIGWEKTCDDPRLPNNKYFAYAEAAVDDGTTIRWEFTGPVNIELHDAYGHGISHPATFFTPPDLVVPHAITGDYGITWQNIDSRVPDISAAAWTDVQATIARNAGLANASASLQVYFSPGALLVDPLLEEAATTLRRAFELLAAIPRSRSTIFVALTHSERVQTEDIIRTMTPYAQVINDNIDSMFGINPTEPPGSIYTVPECAGNDPGRAGVTLPSTRDLAFIAIGVCPPVGNSNPHVSAVRGVTHEYVHTVQSTFADGQAAMQATPCWMREGQAQWVPSAIAPTFDEYLIRQAYHPFYMTGYGLEGAWPGPRVWTAQEVQDYLTNSSITATCFASNEYSLSASMGHAAIEAMASIGGADSVFAINSHLGRGETLNQAFTAVYGISWDVTKPILARVVAEKITRAWDPDALTYQTRPH